MVVFYFTFHELNLIIFSPFLCDGLYEKKGEKCYLGKNKTAKLGAYSQNISQVRISEDSQQEY